MWIGICEFKIQMIKKWNVSNLTWANCSDIDLVRSFTVVSSSSKSSASPDPSWADGPGGGACTDWGGGCAGDGEDSLPTSFTYGKYNLNMT